MGAYSGPNVVDDSLVFYYDTFNQLKSYKGEPTTNLTTNTPSLNGWQGSYTVVNSSTKTFLITTQQNTASVGSAWRTFYWSVSSYIGSYITISADVEFVSETNCTFSSITIGQGNTGQYPYHLLGSPAADRQTVDTKPVEKIHMTWSGVINATGIVGFTQWIGNTTVDGANAVLRISNVQIEAKAHETPFENGTRSNTQGLLDLTGNSTIDLSNVSFDSNAQIDFDGTDDYINLGDNSLFDFTNGVGTVEAIVKFPSSWTAGSQYPNLISKGATAGWDTDGWSLFGFRSYGSGTGYTLGIGIRNTGTVNTALAYNQPADTWLHVIGTLDGSSIKLYVNGALVTTNSQTVNPGDNNTNVYIGRDASSQYFPGDIPHVKTYSRALTASEVQSNYQAIRTRYGI